MNKPKFEAYAEEAYLPMYAKRRRSNIAYNFRKYAYPLIGDMTLDVISPIETDRILEGMYGSGITDTTVVNIYRNIKRVFQLAIRNGILHRDPCTAHFHHCDNTLFSFPEDIETHQRLMAAIEKLPLRNFYGFSYTTGISIMELRSLHESDYNPAKRMLHMDTAKHCGSYLLPDMAVPYIEAEIRKKAELQHIEDNLLFVTGSGSHIPHTHTRICTHIIRIMMSMPGFTTRYLWMSYGNMLHLTGGDNWR